MHGHHAGDMALITVVEVIRQYIRKTDKLIRYGGDEFLLLLPEIDSENFARKLNKIKKKLLKRVSQDMSGLSYRSASEVCQQQKRQWKRLSRERINGCTLLKCIKILQW